MSLLLFPSVAIELATLVFHTPGLAADGGAHGSKEDDSCDELLGCALAAHRRDAGRRTL